MNMFIHKILLSLLTRKYGSKIQSPKAFLSLHLFSSQRSAVRDAFEASFAQMPKTVAHIIRMPVSKDKKIRLNEEVFS